MEIGFRGLDSRIQWIHRSQRIGFMDSTDSRIQRGHRIKRIGFKDSENSEDWIHGVKRRSQDFKYEIRKHRWIKNRKYKIYLLTVKKTGGEEIIITL